MPRLTPDLYAAVSRLIQSESKELFLREGGRIHRVDAATADLLAHTIIDATQRYGSIPLAYFLAVIRRESIFDPQAFNPNISHNPSGAFQGTDHGIGQISGAVLWAAYLPTRRKHPDWTDAQYEEWLRGLAYDPVWAVDYMGRTYRGLLDWAKVMFPESDKFYVATLAYNKGESGARAILEGRAALATRRAGRIHAEAVMGHYRRYEKLLGRDGHASGVGEGEGR